MTSALATNPNECPTFVEADASSSQAHKAPDMNVSDYVNKIRRAPTAEVIMDVAGQVVKLKASRSHVMDSTAELMIRNVDLKSVTLGHVLGRGGFCIVNAVNKIVVPKSGVGTLGRAEARSSFISKLVGNSSRRGGKASSFRKKKADDDDASVSDFHSVCGSDFAFATEQEGKGMKKKARRGRYVVKRVTPELAFTNKIAFFKGCVDLAVEAKYLAALEHPNIINLGAISVKGPCDFIILEMLTETLTKRFKTWMDKDRRCKGITGIFAGSKKLIQDLYHERIEASYDIANAMKYLHSKQIVFRDLKPDNIGFDRLDQLKLFDFGLARELFEDERTKDGLYAMTGMTGSMRYMAPEVALGLPYNVSADVYSWAILMWYILALEPPFGYYTEDMMADRVVQRGSRPAIFDAWPEAISSLMRRGWDATIAERPTFSEICSTMKTESLWDSENDPTVHSGVSASQEGRAR
jgi:serine/threonine protein kinase